MESEPTEPRAESAPVIGTIEIQESDFASAIVQMSPIYRLRWLGALWALWFGISGALGSAPKDMLGPLLATIIVLAILFVLPRLTARRLVRSVAQGGDRHVSYRFDEEGVTIRAAGVTTTFAYRKLVRMREVKTAFLLYLNSMIANIVPKRAFSEGDLSRVRAFLAPYAKGKGAGTVPPRLIVIWLALIVVFMLVWQYLSAHRTGF